MVDIKVDETHIRSLTATLRTKEIEKILIQAIINGMGFDTNSPSTQYKFNWQDETEGSPSYKVGVQCHVTVTKDMNYVTVPMPEIVND